MPLEKLLVNIFKKIKNVDSEKLIEDIVNHKVSTSIMESLISFNNSIILIKEIIGKIFNVSFFYVDSLV